MGTSNSDDLGVDETRVRRLIEDARGGSDDAMGQLAEACRPYLLLIANQEIGDALKAKVGASDLVQETLVQARNDIGGFAGQNQQQLHAWLRRILIHEIADARRHHEAQKRSVTREQAMTSDSVVSHEAIGFVRDQVTPSTEATAREQAAELRKAVQRLPEDYIRVIDLRNWQQQSWDAVGEALDRTPEAARKLWSRAIERLKVELDRIIEETADRRS